MAKARRQSNENLETSLDNKQPRLLPTIIVDAKASGSNGGSITTGYTARNINTLTDPEGNVANPESFTGTGGTNTNIILNPGTYLIKAVGPSYNCEIHKLRLQNITDSTTLVHGSNAYSRVVANAGTDALLIGYFTITSTKTVQLQHKGGGAQATNGMGLPASDGVLEVFTVIELLRIS